MRREDLLDILSKMSPRDLTLSVITLRNGGMITIDSLIRSEEEYMVIRGREGGSTDEARGFFVPYDDVCYLKLDRVIKGNEILRMYGENIPEDVDRMMDPTTQVGSVSAADAASAAAAAKAAAPASAPAMDPAAIAKANLLERIRAARTSAGTSNLPTKK
jgi:hypothetical protein